MPPLPVIAKVTRAQVSGLTPRGTRWANVTHYRFTGAGDPAGSDLDALALCLSQLYGTAVPAWAGDHGILYWVKTTGTMDSIKLLRLDGASASAVYSYAIAGTDAGDALPAETSLVVTYRTGLRGPRHRGRSYLPPFTEPNNNANGTAGAPVASLLTLFSAFQTHLSAALNWEQVVASYVHADWNLVTQYTISSDFKVQRRRRS